MASPVSAAIDWRRALRRVEPADARVTSSLSRFNEGPFFFVSCLDFGS